MLDTRWLMSPDGQVFLRAVAEIIEETRKFGTRAVPTGNPATDWTTIKKDYINGLDRVSPLAITPADESKFDQELDRVYKMRYENGYATLDVSKAGAQAVILGNFTGTMMRLHMGDLGNYPKPIAPANLKLDLYYLDWARDFIGFWVFGHYRWSIKPHRLALDSFDLVPVEFDKGCVFC